MFWAAGAGLALMAGVAGLAWVLQRNRLPSASIPEIAREKLSPPGVALVDKYAAAVRLEPRSGMAWGRLGGVLKTYGLADAAERCLAEAQRLEPNEARWPYLRGALHEISAHEVALEHFGRAARLAGDAPEIARLRLARLLTEAGRFEEGRREAEALWRARPACAPAQLLLAQLRMTAGDWPEAAHLANGCLLSPHTARAARTLIALVHRRSGETNAAERVGREAANAPPDLPWPDPFEAEVLIWCDDPRSLSDAAQRSLLGGRVEQAAPSIERLTKEHPDFAEGWLLLGRLHQLRKQPVPAEQALLRHLALDTNSVNGHFQLGMSLLSQQRFAEASAAFANAIALKPDLGPAHYNLAFSRVRSGNLREAVEPFRQAIRHNPERIDAYILLADVHVQLGEFAEAARLADLAERLDPGDRRLPTLHRRLGVGNQR